MLPMNEQKTTSAGLLVVSSLIISYAFHKIVFLNDILTGLIYLASGFIFLICSGIFDELTKNGDGKIFHKGKTKVMNCEDKND